MSKNFLAFADCHQTEEKCARGQWPRGSQHLVGHLFLLAYRIYSCNDHTNVKATPRTLLKQSYKNIFKNYRILAVPLNVEKVSSVIRCKMQEIQDLFFFFWKEGGGQNKAAMQSFRRLQVVKAQPPRCCHCQSVGYHRLFQPAGGAPH